MYINKKEQGIIALALELLIEEVQNKEVKKQMHKTLKKLYAAGCPMDVQFYD